MSRNNWTHDQKEAAMFCFETLAESVGAELHECQCQEHDCRTLVMDRSKSLCQQSRILHLCPPCLNAGHPVTVEPATGGGR